MKKLSESVWSDIHKRSNGEQVRKENKNIDWIYDYITSHYRLVNADKYRDLKFGKSEFGILSIPVSFDSDYKRVLHRDSFIRIISSWNDTFINYITIDSVIKNEKTFDKLNNDFILKSGRFVASYEIFPKDGRDVLTPDFLLEIIDFFVDNTDEKEKVIERI